MCQPFLEHWHESKAEERSVLSDFSKKCFTPHHSWAMRRKLSWRSLSVSFLRPVPSGAQPFHPGHNLSTITFKHDGWKEETRWFGNIDQRKNEKEKRKCLQQQNSFYTIVEYIFSNISEKYAGQNLNIQALTIKARRKKNLHNQVKGGHPAWLNQFMKILAQFSPL